MKETVDDALSSQAEQGWVDFKREFDPASPGEWCEIVKDIVAMANSGGGFIVIGLENDGSPSSAELEAVLALDPATLTDKIRRYTGVQFGSFSLAPQRKGTCQVQVICIEGTSYPIVFTNVGSYELPSKKQGRAFSVGQVYFRHGAKSEPGTTDDLRDFVDREVCRIRQEWLGNIRKVVEAPVGSVVSVVPTSPASNAPATAVPARFVNAPDAVPVPWRSPDETHPHRQKEALVEVNRRISGLGIINGFDIQLVRRRFKMETDPNLVYKPKFGSFQYSQAFVDWLVDEFENDKEFFHRLREENRAGHV